MVIVLLASSTIALYVVLSSEAKHPVMVSPVTFSLPVLARSSGSSQLMKASIDISTPVNRYFIFIIFLLLNNYYFHSSFCSQSVLS